MTTIPESHQDLLDQAIPVAVATTMPDNQPHTTMLWFKWTGDAVQMSTTAARQKTVNIRNNPHVSLLFVDPDNMYRYLEMRGRVDIRGEGEEAAYELINELAKKYTGKDQYYGGVAPAENKAKETRVILHVEPEHVVSFG